MPRTSRRAKPFARFLSGFFPATVQYARRDIDTFFVSRPIQTGPDLFFLFMASEFHALKNL